VQNSQANPAARPRSPWVLAEIEAPDDYRVDSPRFQRPHHGDRRLACREDAAAWQRIEELIRGLNRHNRPQYLDDPAEISDAGRLGELARTGLRGCAGSAGVPRSHSGIPSNPAGTWGEAVDLPAFRQDSSSFTEPDPDVLQLWLGHPGARKTAYTPISEPCALARQPLPIRESSSA
jgi:hypothetical protein